MKRTIKLIILASMLTAFAASALAQSKECNDENKAAWYDTFLKNYKGDAAQQKVAYDAAKTYLNSCPADPNDKIAEFMREKFVKPYDALRANQDLATQFQEAVDKKNYADQLRLGKQVLATSPDNPAIYLVMGAAGAGDPALLSESAQYAKKAIELIEAGKPFKPYASKDQALASMNYIIGKASLANAPADAIPYFLKAARFESDLKKNYQLYLDLAAAYENGPRAKLTKDYETAVGPDKTETPQSKLVLENLNQVIDRQIDAFARAAALASDANTKKAIMENLTELYKYRNKSETGLNELVASVLTKPLPDMPTPLSSLPTPTATPGGASGTNGGSPTGTTVGNPTSTTAKPAASNSATSTGAQKPATTGTAKPTPSPTPKTKPRTNYRRG